MLLGSALIFGGCSLRVPTGEEQEKLAASGAFASGAPAWVTGVKSPNRRDAGAIPQGYLGVLPRHSLSRLPNEHLEEHSNVAEQVKTHEEAAKIDSASAASFANKDAPDSPLARIEKLCPAVEPDVRKALVNTVLDERLAEYMSLSRRCSQSADIWGWLAKDHLAKGNAMSARAAAERAIDLDKRNGDAAAVLAELNHQ